MKDDIKSDPLISKYGVDILSFGGMRSNELGPHVVLAASQYKFVLVAVGNNDLTKFFDNEAKPPIEKAANLIAFSRVLGRKGVKVLTLGLIKRRDVDEKLVQEVNFYLFKNLGRQYVPSKLKEKHIDNFDKCHLNNDGKLDFKQLLHRSIVNRLC